jgi:hypothetical protein
MRPSTPTHSDVAHPSLLTMTVPLFEKWNKLSPRSRAMVQTQVLSAFYATHVTWASNEAFRLLAIPVLRIACEHDRM